KTLRRFNERRNLFNREGKASSTTRSTRVLPPKGFWRAREKFAPHVLHRTKPILNDCRASGQSTILLPEQEAANLHYARDFSPSFGAVEEVVTCRIFQSRDD